MGGISGNQYVKSSGITRGDFKKQLEQQGLKGEKLDQALSIFDRYSETNNVEGEQARTLNEAEQLAAREEFDRMDEDRDGEVSKKEFKHGDVKTERKAYKAFMEALNTITSSDENRGVIIDNAGQYSIVKGATTETAEDDVVTDYTTDDVPPEEVPKGELEESTSISKPETLDFKDEGDVRTAIYRYIINDNSLSNEEAQKLFDSIRKDASDKTSNNPKFNPPQSYENLTEVTVTFNGKEYKMRNEGGKIVINRADDSGNYVDIRQDLIDSETTDVKHSYLNKHGKTGNAKSVFDGREIKNTSNRRQHVDPVQTFASMLLNNNEETSLSFNNNLSGQDVIDVVLAGQTDRTEHTDEISLKDLVRYLTAAINESRHTTSLGNNTGTRSAAGDVDLDVKDMANLGAVFKKYAGDDGYLNASELDSLIKDLTSGNSMTKLARKALQEEAPYVPPKKQPVKPDKPNPPTPPDVRPTPHTGRSLEADRTRYIAGSDKKQSVDYHYENGLRTIVENGKEVLDENIAEYTDHGMFGAGKKDFIRISGLPSNVRAEIVKGKLGQDMQVEVKDANGDVRYYEVKHNNGKYKLGDEVNKKGVKYKNGSPTDKVNESIIKRLFGNSGKDLKFPEGLTVETKHKKPVYKLNGKVVPADVARAHILAYNNPSLKPTKLRTIIHRSPEEETKLLEERHQTPVRLIDNAIVDNLAQKQGLRKTFGSNYGWYYSNSEQVHYYFDEGQQKFIKDEKSRFVDSDGTVKLKS